MSDAVAVRLISDGSPPTQTWYRTPWDNEFAGLNTIRRVAIGSNLYAIGTRDTGASITSSVWSWNTDGDLRWEIDTGDTPSSLAIDGSFVYVGGGGYLKKLNASDGSEVWSFEDYAPEVVAAISINSDGIYIFSGGRILRVTQAGTEDPAFTQINSPTIGAYNVGSRNMAVGGGNVYVYARLGSAGTNWYFWAFDNEGTELYEIEAGDGGSGISYVGQCIALDSTYAYIGGISNVRRFQLSDGTETTDAGNVGHAWKDFGGGNAEIEEIVTDGTNIFFVTQFSGTFEGASNAGTIHKISTGGSWVWSLRPDGDELDEAGGINSNFGIAVNGGTLFTGQQLAAVD